MRRRRAAQMPDWYGDHKLMIFPAIPVDPSPAWVEERGMHSLSSRLASLGRTLCVAVAGLAVAVTSVGTAAAQSVPVVRDAEIEALVRDYARPVLKAAGLGNSGIDIVLVNDRSFNAFVAGRRIFVNTGALLQAETPNEIIGVLAHEAGHIAGGHQERLRDQLARAQTMAIVAMLLGVGAAAAAAAAGSGELAGAGGGLALGGGEFARRGLLGYQRSEETTADRAAINYLEATGQSGRGMLRTFQRFQSALSLSGSQVDPYQVSHPMPRERIANLEDLVQKSRFADRTDPPELQLRHDLMRAKIAVYTDGQGAASRMIAKGGLPGQYADALQTFLRGSPRAAAGKVDALIKAQPRNPYFRELRGDVLMKANRPEAAAESYAVAVKLDPNRSGILRIGLGQAYLAMGDQGSLAKAVKEIRAGLDRDKENALGYRYLAQAYGQMGDIAQADLATAEGNFYRGAYNDAKVFAARAQQRMKRGEPGWVRAQDIINFKAPKKSG